MVKPCLTMADLSVNHFRESQNEEVACRILHNVESVTANLELVPTILQLLIEDFRLESTEELEEPEIYNLLSRRNMIYDTLMLTQNIIFDTLKGLENVANEEIERLRGVENEKR